MEFMRFYSENYICVANLFIILTVFVSICGVGYMFNHQNNFIESINYKCNNELGFLRDPIVYDDGNYIIACDNRVMTDNEVIQYIEYSRVHLVVIILFIFLLPIFLLFLIPSLIYLIIKYYYLYFRRKH